MSLKIPKLASGKSVFGKTPSRRPGKVIPQRGKIPDWAVDDYLDDAFDDYPGAGPLAVNRKKGAPNAKGVMRGGRVSAQPSTKPIYRGGSLDRQAQQVKRENRGANKEQLKAALNKRVSYLRKGRK